jgi:hypothetical protein
MIDTIYVSYPVYSPPPGMKQVQLLGLDGEPEGKTQFIRPQDETMPLSSKWHDLIRFSDSQICEPHLSIQGSIRKVITGNNANNNIITYEEICQVLQDCLDELGVTQFSADRGEVGRIDVGRVYEVQDSELYAQSLLNATSSYKIKNTYANGISVRNTRYMVRIYSKYEEQKEQKVPPSSRCLPNLWRNEVQVTKSRILEQYGITSIKQATDPTLQKAMYDTIMKKANIVIPPIEEELVKLLKDHDLNDVLRYAGVAHYMQKGVDFYRLIGALFPGSENHTKRMNLRRALKKLIVNLKEIEDSGFTFLK